MIAAALRAALAVRDTEITVTLPVDVVLAARRALWETGRREAAVRVLQAYAQARTAADQPLNRQEATR